jgi:hypothetical protein
MNTDMLNESRRDTLKSSHHMSATDSASKTNSPAHVVASDALFWVFLGARNKCENLAK